MAYTSYFWERPSAVQCRCHPCIYMPELLSGALPWAHPTVVCMFCLLVQHAAIDSFSTLFDLVTQTVYVAQGFWIIKLLCVDSNTQCLCVHLSILSIHPHPLTCYLYVACVTLLHFRLSYIQVWLSPIQVSVVMCVIVQCGFPWLQ
jgi:hypothetical protein